MSDTPSPLPAPSRAPAAAPATITIADDLVRAIRAAGLEWDTIRDAVEGVYLPPLPEGTTTPERAAAYLAGLNPEARA